MKSVKVSVKALLLGVGDANCEVIRIAVCDDKSVIQGSFQNTESVGVHRKNELRRAVLDHLQNRRSPPQPYAGLLRLLIWGRRASPCSRDQSAYRLCRKVRQISPLPAASN